MELKRGGVLAGQLVVEAMLARDANAVVIAAKQPSHQRLVTVKVFSTTDSGQRFLTTYARASQIKSDFAPKLLDLGTLPDGKPYVVREFVDGEDLSAVISRGVLTAMEAVQFALQACDAVAATHVVGTVHGGLKPSSLMRTQLPSGVTIVKVLNCGLARVGAAASPAPVSAYRAPEQLTEGRKVDGRCDIWAIGAILYELLAGQPPFAGSTTKSLLKRVLNESPRPLRSVRPDISEPLEAIIHRCLEKSPDARFSTIADLATALGPFGSVHTIALPMHIARLKLASNVLPSSTSRSSMSSPRLESSSSSVSSAPASERAPWSSSSLPVNSLQMLAGDDEGAVRKMTSEGRIERLDADAAAVVMREKRVAAEASVLARDARANPRAAPVEEDTGMRVLDEAAAGAAPPSTPTEPTEGERGARWNLRHPAVIVLLAALAMGMLVGLIVRIVTSRPQAEHKKPREIIIEDRPNGAPVKRSAD